jgi:hypothetical protein
MQIAFYDKRGPIRRRLVSYGGTGEKAESAKALWRMSSTF